MRKSWGRLGATVGAVALLAGGLVGVTAPAQANHTDPFNYKTEIDCQKFIKSDSGEPVVSEEVKAACAAQGADFSRWGHDPKYTDFWNALGQCKPGKVQVGLCVDAPTQDPGTDSGSGNEPETPYTPPPPCWDASLNNCPIGGALRFAAPKYAMVGVPVTMYAYATWRPDASSPAQPTNGTAIIRVDGEDYAGVEFKDGVAEWRFIPETEGMKEFTASGVLFSGLSGGSAYIDTVPARTYVLEFDPIYYSAALKQKAVEVGDTYVITDPNQARSYVEDRYEWRVSDKSDDVCAVYETKKGAVKAKFNSAGTCTVIWMDKESEETGKYTFIAKK